MTRESEENQMDRDLWSAARAAWRDAGADAPDALTLAAYLDGRLEAAEQARVEAWMAGSDEALELMLAARSAGSEPAPAALVARAQGLIGGAEPAKRRVGGPVARLLAPFGDWFAGALQPAGWAASAAALLLLAAGSFELGQFGTQEIAAVQSLVGQEVAATLPQTSDDSLL